MKNVIFVFIIFFFSSCSITSKQAIKNPSTKQKSNSKIKTNTKNSSKSQIEYTNNERILDHVLKPRVFYVDRADREFIYIFSGKYIGAGDVDGQEDLEKNHLATQRIVVISKEGSYEASFVESAFETAVQCPSYYRNFWKYKIPENLRIDPQGIIAIEAKKIGYDSGDKLDFKVMESDGGACKISSYQELLIKSCKDSASLKIQNKNVVEINRCKNDEHNGHVCHEESEFVPPEINILAKLNLNNDSYYLFELIDNGIKTHEVLNGNREKLDFIKSESSSCPDSTDGSF